jgi:GNAT superfamily N-acetyltransferase
VSRFGSIEKLRRDHDVDGFNCGKDSLNLFLKRHAWVNQQSNAAQTYVLAQDLRVTGYYSLAAGWVVYEHAPERGRKGMARHPIPVVLLARLAVDVSIKGQGVGAGLLKDALMRVASAADLIGACALLTHAKDEEARRFYLHLNLEPSLSDPLHLFLLVKDIR